MVTLGPPGAGKSTTVETLSKQEPCCVDHKTEVADLRQLDISPIDTIHVYDEGGDDVYKITSPIFNTPKSIAMMVHNMTKVDDGILSNSADIIRQNLLLHPENQVLVVLTHIDLCNENVRQENLNRIQSYFTRVIDKEIQLLRASQSNKGSKREKIIDLLEKQKAEMKYFPISCETYEGVDTLRNFLKEILQKGRVFLPLHWVQFYKGMMKQSYPFLRKKELRRVFIDPTKNLKWPRSLPEVVRSLARSDENAAQIESEFRQALLYFTDVGLILYYDSVFGLNEYIFHRPQFVVDVLKSVFNHQIGDVLNYDQNELLRHRFKREYLELLANRFQKEGLVDKRLLDVLWEQYRLSNQDKEALQKLMESFHFCYPISKTSTLLYLPWFTANNVPPDSVNLKKLSRFSKKQMSVQFNCRFVPCIPQNAFETIIVGLQKEITDKGYAGERYTWKQGLQLTLNKTEALLIRNEIDSIISFCVSGEPSEVEAIWDISKKTEANVASTFDQYDGINAELCYVCAHCLLVGKSQPCCLSADIVLRSSDSSPMVKCGDDSVPSGLVRACSGSGRQASQIEKYLEDNFQATLPEFFAAAVNETGDGEFLSVVANKIKNEKRQMSSDHIDQLRINHENFCSMSNTWTIVIRMFSRGVLSLQQKEMLVRKYTANKEKGPHVTNDFLMECVYRMTYGQLFFFRKTLIETGQISLANTFPVEFTPMH